MNKSAKKAKWQIWAKRQINPRVFLFKKETQNRDKPIQSWRGSKTGGKIDVNFVFLLFIADVALNPSFSNRNAERSADHNDGETFTHKERGLVKVGVKLY